MKKIRTKKQASPTWIETLNGMNIDIDQLSLKELKAFKDVDRYLNAPIRGPKEWEYLIRSFRLLTSFAMITIYEKEFPSLSKCWEELDRLFIHDEMFDDEVFVQSWIFCDFPFADQKTVLDCFEEFLTNKELFNDCKYFIDQMRISRLGLYQEIASTKKTITFRELFTGKIIKIENSIPEFESGEIFLTRLVETGGKIFSFGHPKCWPKEFKVHIENMVINKLYYFEAPSTEEQYELFMKYAGPYWMSCVIQDEESPILPPNHYLTYLK
ncbi:MAG: hypothetical protein HQM11_04440 [SAR324 cluster bacterium]|nr:hypothetical protein [SAR324 cluster bacterium]